MKRNNTDALPRLLVLFLLLAGLACVLAGLLCRARRSAEDEPEDEDDDMGYIV